MEPIWVEYEKTIDDAVATTTHSFRRSQDTSGVVLRHRITITLCLVVPILIFGAMALTDRANGAKPADLLWYLIPVCVAVAAVVYPFLRGASLTSGSFDAQAFYRDYYSKPENQWQFGRHAAGVTDGGFVLVTPVSETRYHWHAIEQVLDDDDAVSVWIGGMAMGTVPRRAFADEEAFRRFVDAARRKVAETNPPGGGLRSVN